MPVEVIHSKTGSSDTDERSSHQNSNMWKLLEENVSRLKNSFPRVIQKTLFGQGKLNLCLSHTFSNTAFGIASNIYSYRNWSFFWNYVLIYSLLCVWGGAVALIRKPEDNSQEPVLLHCVGSRYPIQAARLEGKPLLAEPSCWALGIGFPLKWYI